MRSTEFKKTIENSFPCQVGIIKARIFTELRQSLQKYQKINHDLQIVENNIDKRINPFLLYKAVKSIIVVSFPYVSKAQALENKSHVVSRSSWGLDYHIVLKDKLKAVLEILESNNKTGIILSDNHPLPEKHLAYLAGLGNYGKNTLLINPQYGSFFFIGLILTDMEFSDYDTPKYEDICQSCNLCLKACPTGAISEARYLNVGRCMSYLTQSKALIPEAFLGKFVKFTFGCDLCQSACVYNNRDDIPVLNEFIPRGLEVVKVKNLQNLSNKDFKEKYKTLAASYRGKNVLLRNAILVSANRFDKADLQDLAKTHPKANKYLQQAINYANNKLKKE